jgi:hypothetical protein
MQWAALVGLRNEFEEGQELDIGVPLVAGISDFAGRDL